MIIHAFNFTGSRDLELRDMMHHSLRKTCRFLGRFESVNTDGMGYGNGAGWEASMMKLDALRELVRQGIGDDDWVLSVDSDVIFCNDKIFDWLQVVTSLRYFYGSIVGIQQVTDLAHTKIGTLYNMSGCSIYIRGHIAKKICELSKEQLDNVRADFKEYVLCENEDIVLSYLAQMLGAKNKPIPDEYYHGNFEEDISNRTLKSFYHLNYLPESFLGVPTTGKWDIPKVLRNLNIQL